jgi:hypothetical protein
MKGLLASTALLAAGCSFDSPGSRPSSSLEPDAGTVADALWPTDASTVSPCGAAYTYDYGFHRYRLINNGMGWAQAKSACEGDGGYLLKIETAGEDQRVEDAFFFGPQEVWIGLSDINQDGNYFWTDGTPAQEFSHWNGSPPNAGSADCVAKNTYTSDGRWYTRSCTDNRAVICECDP